MTTHTAVRLCPLVPLVLLPVGILLSLAGAAPAQPHASDAVLRIEAGRLTTAAVSAPAGLLVPQRVFAAELADFAGSWFSNDPGFDSLPGTFAPGQQLVFRIEGPLQALDSAASPPRFRPAPDARLRVRFGAQERFTPPPSGVGPPPGTSPPPATSVDGFAISAASTGQFHRHLGFTLQSQPDLALTPADGAYALSLTWQGVGGAPARSRPIWIVLSKQASPAQLDAALLAAQRLACPSDIAGPGAGGSPDGELTADDIIAFVQAFTAANLSTADIAGPGGSAGPDGELTADDIIAFVNAFIAGC